jgi:putative ABC transport system permease protein
MINNFIKIALRSLVKFKGFATINLIGLSLGLTAGSLVILYVLDELSYDQFHENGARVFRVNTRFYTEDGGGIESGMDTNGWPIGNILRKDFPEVEAVAYIRGASGLLINKDGRHFRERLFYVSPEFLQMFSFPLVKGNPDKALDEPRQVVISESMERKYFTGTDAIGKELTVADTLQLMVTGVMSDVPGNSHIQADMLISFSTFETLNSWFSYDEGWGNINMGNYVMLREGTDLELFQQKAGNLYEERAAEMLKDWGTKAAIFFEPVDKLYLNSKVGNSRGPAGSLDRIYLVAGIATFVILLACINFVNLTTARSVYRAREVGLRKVAGSTRQSLVIQFLTESFMLTIISFVPATILITFLLPLFNSVMDKQYKLSTFADPVVMMIALLLIVVISVLSGLYPAWVLSGMRPSEVLKGKLQTGAAGVRLRRVLVVFQFVISAALAIGTLIVIDQLRYMQSRDLGFGRDQVIVVNAARAKTANPEGAETFKNEIKALSFVENVSHSGAMPGVRGWDGQVAYPEGKSGANTISTHYMPVDAEFVPTLQIEMINGRNFDRLREVDMKDGLVINEEAAAAMGWSNEEAIGRRIESPSGHPAGEVIGVMKNYHQEGLQEKIEPVVLDINPAASYLFIVRYNPTDTQQLIRSVEDLWKKHYPGYDFNYFFLDDNFATQYQAEQRIGKVFGLFAIVTVAIAAIGLIGMVSFMVASRTKEVGVRKVLGASTSHIVGLLSKEFLVLVAIANIVAAPVAWYLSGQWLANFAYRMAVNPMVFVWTLLIGLGITMITVGYQTFRAASSDPVKSLRYE